MSEPISTVKDLQFFITGASRGLGLGLVTQILELGGNVIATCRNPDAAVELNQLKSLYDEPRLIILQLDVTNKEALEDIRGTIRRKGIDTIDVCIANAGVASKNHPYDPAWTCPEDDLLKTFQTNTMGTLFTAQSIAPLLSMSKKAKLFVGISSRLGSLSEAMGVGGYTSYRISKAGMNMACLCMAHDPSMMGIGIKFLILHPGWVQTEMGSAGGRRCPLQIDESCNGMVNVIQRAIDVQMYLMGSSVYEERTWNKTKNSTTNSTSTSSSTNNNTTPALPVPSTMTTTTEPSLKLKCPYSGTTLPSSISTPVVASPPPPPSTSTSSVEMSASKCPYHHQQSANTASKTTVESETTTVDNSSTEPLQQEQPQQQQQQQQQQASSKSKCPFSFGDDDAGDNDRLSFGSLDDGEPASCPFGTIQPDLPAVTEDKFHSIAERFHSLASQSNSNNFFENQFLQQSCVFVGYDGVIIPW